MAERYEGFVDVLLAGPKNEFVSILLKKLHGEAWESGKGDERWFVATVPSMREILATALAAIVSNRLVMVVIPDTGDNMPIGSMLLTHHSSQIPPSAPL